MDELGIVNNDNYCWWLLFLTILSDDYHGPCSETIKRFKEKYEEKERKRIFADKIKHMCPRKEYLQ